jgi:hypothetical protein
VKTGKMLLKTKISINGKTLRKILHRVYIPDM